VDKLADCLQQLVSDAAKRRAMGEAGHAEAVAKYTWTAVATRLEEIYQQAERHARSKR